ncbi:hypothetical protein I4U23_022916 [Adineta vaga]|nr:hypothetical protein I4U23_022916 [Adineta vaga]
MTNKRLIVVVGIHGRQASSVVEVLLQYPNEWLIRGTTGEAILVHNQEFVRQGVEIVKCDISNQEECCQAFKGAYGVFSINKHWDAMDQGELTQALNLVEAAKIANVQHFITSGLPDTTAFEKSQFEAPYNPIKQTQIENYIRRLSPDATFPHVTFIHMGFYYQNFITFFVFEAENLEFRYPLLSPARIPLYDVRDTGKIVYECFRQPEKWGNGQTVPIVAEQLTIEEMCARIRDMTEKDVQFIPLPFEEALLKLHRETVNNMRWYNDIGSTDGQQAEKTKEIYPNMKTFIEWLREIQWLME